MKKSAAGNPSILVEVYGEHDLAERFKSCDFGLEDEERRGQPKKFEDVELEAILEEDPKKIKRKKNLQMHWEWTIQQLPNV